MALRHSGTLAPWHFGTSELRHSLVGMSGHELACLMKAWGEPSYRGYQIARWVYQKAVSDFEQMTDLPLALRSRLAEEAQIGCTQIAVQQNSSDGVIKCLLKLKDDQHVECVLLPYEGRVSVCLSTQVGCAMGCHFCATAQGGFTRNLTAGEIVDQLLTLQRLSPNRISHIVYMGMGEPLLNLDNVLQSLRLFNQEVGIGMRKFTLSTVGIVPKIRELAQERLQLTLAVSLHAPDDETRRALMPVARKWSLSDLLKACREYFELTRRRVTFEYVLLREVNDTPQHAQRLARLLTGFPCLINLIPFNYVSTPEGFQRPEPERVQRFRTLLETAGLNVTQRVERGHEIDAACGQLRGKHLGKPIPQSVMRNV